MHCARVGLLRGHIQSRHREVVGARNKDGGSYSNMMWHIAWHTR